MNLNAVVGKLHQYAITVSHISVIQILWRIRKLILRHLWKTQKQSLSVCSVIEVPSTIPTFGFIPETVRLQDPIRRADQICRGEFSFLNQCVISQNHSLDWNFSPDQDRLWTYNLNYFEYAYDLLWAYRATGQSSYLDCLFQLIQAWIAQNPFWQPIPWNPYTVSKRLIVWTTLLGHLKDDPGFQDYGLGYLLASIVQQANFLAHNPEYDISNNHLITNARALIWVGIYFREDLQARRWLEKGLALLEREISNQILADGGHNEHSASYQLVVLQDLLETALLMEKAELPVPPHLTRAISRMYDFLAVIVKPDGSLPMLNDTVPGYPVHVSDILAVGAVYLERPALTGLVNEQPGAYFDWLLGQDGRQIYEAMPDLDVPVESCALPQSGYYVLRSPECDSYLIFDCGSIGPRHSPGHGHADTLGFELAAHGQTLVIDPGVYEYMESEWRDYFRGTAAHNTVTVDHQDQSVFWSSFRVAEMARARLIRWETSDAYDEVEGEHDGYTRLKSPVVHRRHIRYSKPNCWIITDTLESDGRRAHRYDLWFHLTPAHCLLGEDTHACKVYFPDNVILDILPEHPTGSLVDIQSGWISYTWKQKIAAPVVHYALLSTTPVTVFKTTLVVSRQRDTED
jgi:uncharacterized heparinase superfamily protein